MNDTGAALFVLIFFAGGYVFGAYVLYRVGKKFGMGSLGAYFVPVYNVVLICRCAGIPDAMAAGASAWLLGLFIPHPVVTVPSQLVAVGFSVYIWGKVAERFGRSFWPWGLGCGLIGIPVLVLAFDRSVPVHGVAVRSSDEVFDAIVEKEERRLAGPEPIRLVCTSGQYAGSEIDIPAEGIVIGRDPRHANLVLSSEEVSSSHVRLAPDPQDGDYVVVTDLGSTNGTYRLVQRSGLPPRWDRVDGSVRLHRHGGEHLRIGSGAAEFEVR